MSSEFYERLMEHEAPKPHRRKARWPIRTTPPKCDTCRRQLHPDIDHSDCEVAR